MESENLGDVVIVYNPVDFKLISASVAGKRLSDIFLPFNEINYHVVNSVLFHPEFWQDCCKFFDAIRLAEESKGRLLAAQMANYLFEHFTQLWQYYLMHNRHFLGAQLWQHTIFLTWTWENKNNARIHKGTPYFFLGETLLLEGNVDSAFTNICQAIEEDKRSFPTDYRKFPAYSFASIVDKKENHLYPYVIAARLLVSDYVKQYNSEFDDSLSIEELDRVLFNNSELENERFRLVYTLVCILNGRTMDEPRLRDNSFSAFRRLDLLFDLALIVDQVAKNKTNEHYVRESVKQLLANGNPSLKKQYQDDYSNSFGLKDDESEHEARLRLDAGLESLLDRRFKHFDAEACSLFILWVIRNYAAHNVSSSPVVVSRYDDLLRNLMNSLFIVMRRLYS